ncbi:hypothetical protein LC040_02800 [Bacillus tianshenii]|nr:hypothetical protein LC040_02800 [Bacillus tianshenii]
MKQNRFLTSIGITVFSTCLAAVLIGTLIYFKDKPSVSKEEAEKLAIEQAEREGYEDVTLWEKYGSEMYDTYIYSKEEEKDVRAWEIRLDAHGNEPEKNAPAVIYYIHQKSGEVVRTIYGTTPPK